MEPGDEPRSRRDDRNMNESDFDIERLRTLTLQKCDGTISEDGTAELCDLLSESADARESYWQMIAVHSQLDWELGGPSTASVSCPQRDADREDSKARLFTKLALAATLLMAVSLTSWNLAGRQPAAGNMRLVVKQETGDSPVLGTVTEIGNKAKWSLGRSSGGDSNVVRQGDTIWLEEGAIQLRLGSDSIATLESPVIASLLSADRVRLLRGTIKVDVEYNEDMQSQSGLTVETELAEVVDQGTSYSVKADGDSTDVVVFDGSVALNPANQPEGQNEFEHFHTGEAVRVRSDRSFTRIVSVRQSPLLASRKPVSSEPIISSIGDNNSVRDFYNFYEIVHGGMGEDAHAFVDRRHQWNGIENPMPNYLVGGDYVKTFNDDKVATELEIDLTVARPCVLYILLDNRVEVPGWLKEAFQDSGDDIGVDEHLRHLGNKRKVVGAGNSIDQTHSIWRRVLTQPGVITLGRNGAMKDSAVQGEDSPANMYGIVAVGIAGNDATRIAISDRVLLPIDRLANVGTSSEPRRLGFFGNIDHLFGKF